MQPPRRARAVRSVDAGGLEPVEAFARALPRASWFAAVGAPLDPGEVAEMAAWASGLVLGRPSVAPVADWGEAGALARAPAGEGGWWAREEDERRTLLALAGARHGVEALLAALSRVTLAASDAAMAAASIALGRAGIADESLARVAAGAASQAAYHAALGLAAGMTPRHAFAAKFRLHEAGRWPLGIVDGAARLF